MLYVLIAAYLLLCCGLLFVAYSPKYFMHYTTAKATTSFGFVLLCVAAFVLGGCRDIYFFFGMLIALCICSIGDVLLGLANNNGKLFSRYFLIGVIFFMLAHIAFCVLFYMFVPFALYDLALPIILSATTFLCSRSRAFKLKRMKFPAIAYSLFVGLMCTKGIAAAFTYSFNTKGILICIGSILFLISDCIILFLYFYIKPRKFLRFANLLTYYLGVMCLALSCAV